jgi:hypothetical protein
VIRHATRDNENHLCQDCEGELPLSRAVDGGLRNHRWLSDGYTPCQPSSESLLMRSLFVHSSFHSSFTLVHSSFLARDEETEKVIGAI